MEERRAPVRVSSERRAGGGEGCGDRQQGPRPRGKACGGNRSQEVGCAGSGVVGAIDLHDGQADHLFGFVQSRSDVDAEILEGDARGGSRYHGETDQS